jgi:oxygen-independent coproporphyrinogen-3 oxidase
MYDHAVQRLDAIGVHRYEVSNFARFGHESVHNQHYWRPDPWLGLGVGAHSWWPDRRRAQNRADIEGYLQAADPGEEAEQADHPLAAWDYLWSMLRHRDGIDRARYLELTGLSLQVPSSLVDFLEQTAERIRLSDAGYPVADAVARRLYDALPSMKRRSAVSVRGKP